MLFFCLASRLFIMFLLFQIHKLDKAVAAAHTFYVGNPDHLEMRQNLEYYKMMAGVSESDFRDLEAKPHMVSVGAVHLYVECRGGITNVCTSVSTSVWLAVLYRGP